MLPLLLGFEFFIGHAQLHLLAYFMSVYISNTPWLFLDLLLLAIVHIVDFYSTDLALIKHLLRNKCNIWETKHSSHKYDTFGTTEMKLPNFIQNSPLQLFAAALSSKCVCE